MHADIRGRAASAAGSAASRAAAGAKSQTSSLTHSAPFHFSKKHCYSACIHLPGAKCVPRAHSCKQQYDASHQPHFGLNQHASEQLDALELDDQLARDVTSFFNDTGA